MKRCMGHVLWGCLVIAAYGFGKMQHWSGQAVNPPINRPAGPTPDSILPTESGPVLSVASPAEMIDDPMRRRRILDADTIEALGTRFRDVSQPTEGRLAYARLLEGLTEANALQIREQLSHLDPMSMEFREFHYAWGEIAGQEAVLHGAETAERDVSVTMAGWARKDPEAAMAWVSGIDEDSGFNKADLEFGIAHGLSLTDPKAAGIYMVTIAERGDDPHTGKMIGLVTGKVFQAKGPTATATWAQNLPEDSPVRTQTLHRVFEHWTRTDPQSVSAYLVKMPPSPDRNLAIGDFASHLAREDPQSALTWTREITDPHTQDRTIIKVGRTYLNSQPEAAERWLQSADISEEIEAQILQPRS
ncbi:MAG: hypothetical protein AAF514_04945 [Verrucomicrobiota bacterium]